MPPSSTPLAHLGSAIAGAGVHQLPFAHAFVRDVFPQPYYEEMQHYFPDPDRLVTNGQAGRGNQLRARFVFELKADYLSTLQGPQKEFWSDLSGWILGDSLRASILDKFSGTVEARFGRRDQSEYWSDAVLVEDHSTHSIGPHTDHPRKAVTLLFYLPGDDSQAHLGTSIYVPKDADFRCSGLAHHSCDRFNCVSTFPFVPNALVMFAKTDNSFHGIEPIDDASCRRWLLMLNINVNSSR